MHRRLLAAVLLLTTVLQGPALTYAASLGTNGIGDAPTRACADYTLPDTRDCDACCSHGSMPSCASQCPLPTGAAVPPALAASIRIAVRGILIPDAGVAPFADHTPRHPLRPPIVSASLIE